MGLVLWVLLLQLCGGGGGEILKKRGERNRRRGEGEQTFRLGGTEIRTTSIVCLSFLELCTFLFVCCFLGSKERRKQEGKKRKKKKYWGKKRKEKKRKETFVNICKESTSRFCFWWCFKFWCWRRSPWWRGRRTSKHLRKKKRN